MSRPPTSRPAASRPLDPIRRLHDRIITPRYQPGLPDVSWVTTDRSPTRIEPLAQVRMFAVLGTWLEEDVVAATVRNAFTQGCERVLLVDNASPDDTVAEAVAAGAELIRTFATDRYDEELRMRLMNEVVAEVSSSVHETDGDDHIWWLWLDADEFPHGPGGLTLLDYVRTLDRRFRVVGARFLNHYPDRRPFSIVGRHPIDFQPLCDEFVYPMCSEGHRKHPLQRWDADGPDITCLAGFHMATSAERPLIEPVTPIITHHFPYRTEDFTHARLDVLCQQVGDSGPRTRSDDEAAQHIASRYRSLRAVYDRRWSAVESFLPGRPRYGVELTPWTQLVEPADRTIARWYEPEAIDERSIGRRATTGHHGTAKVMAPTCSVIIPAHNGEDGIGLTLPAVLAQVGVDFEVVVVDDGSTDATAAVALSFDNGRVQLIRQPNLGVGAARNAGLGAARGAWVAFVDCDDRPEPEWLLRFSELLAATDVAVAFVGATYQRDDGHRTTVVPEAIGPVFNDMCTLLLSGTLATRTDLVRQIGGYTSELTYSENTELGIRIGEALERSGLRSAFTTESLVTLHDPGDQGSRAYSTAARFASASYIVGRHHARLRREPRLLAIYYSMLGVAAARLGRRGSPGFFAKAVVAQPLEPRHLVRLVASLLPPVHARVWPPAP